MSELVTNKITPSTGSSDTVTLGDSGDTFTIPSGVTMTNSGTATGFGGGKVLQVVQTEKTDVFTTAATSMTAVTGMSVTIRPAATSKVLLAGSCNFSTSAGSNGGWQLFRDSTNIHKGDVDGMTAQWQGRSGIRNDHNQRTSLVPISFLDTHGADGSTDVVYSIKAFCEATGTLYVNRSSNDVDQVGYGRFASCIIAMEIGA